MAGPFVFTQSSSSTSTSTCTLGFLTQHEGEGERSISVASWTWDRQFSRSHSDNPQLWSLPSDQLLAFSVVHNRDLGEFLPHLIIRRQSDLVIGYLSMDDQEFVELTQFSLASDEDFAFPILHLKECWIADGPVVVVVGGQKILIACGGSLEDSNYLEAFANVEKYEGGWTLHEMNFKDFEGEIKLAIIYCGSLRSPSQPELLFSVEYLSSKEDDANKMISGRSSSDWVFIRLGLDMVVSWPKQSDSEKVPFGSAYTTCKELFPKDVHPSFISCVTFAPSHPSALALSLSSWPEQSMKSVWDLFVGCVDGNILKCRLGNIVGKTILTGSPHSLRFAIVAGGQGIILAALNDVARSVIAVCAETLVHLKVWTRVEDIAVGDVQLMGHDQIVLFLSSELDGCESKASNHPFHSPQIQITDLASSICVGSQKVSQFAEGAIQEHKANMLGNLCKSLSMRVEAGLKHVQKLEDQRSAKIELVRSSCRLMQDIVFQSECLKHINESGSALNEERFQCFTPLAFHQFACGRTWFLMVDIEVSTARLKYIRNLSLLLTSLDGCIAGSSSVIESLMPGSVKERLVMAVPLKDIPTSQGLPIINLFVTSSLLPAEESGVEACTSDKEVHTEWIGRLKLESHVFTSSSSPEDIPLDFRKVTPKHILVIKAKGEHAMNLIDDVFQSALKMKRRSSPSDLEAYELVSSNNIWADASIVHIEKTFCVTLRAEDLRHLSALKACLISALPNQFEFVPSVSHPECQGMIKQGLECIEEELLVEEALLSSMQGEERKIRKEMELQMATDRCISSLLKYGFS